MNTFTNNILFIAIEWIMGMSVLTIWAGLLVFLYVGGV